jgi:hypothetical protein
MNPSTLLNLMQLTLLVALSFAAGMPLAATYPDTIAFSLSHAVPKLTCLNTTLDAKLGDDVPVVLNIHYDAETGISCPNSTVSALSVDCRITQRALSYTISALHADPRTKVTLAGKYVNPTANAT